MKKIVLILMLFLSIAFVAHAEWTEDKIISITNEIQKTGIKWTKQQTEELLRQARFTGDFTEVIMTDKGVLRIKIMGETFLLNGKDISGNLGSKITHGNNSPIIDNIQNSQITTGNESPIDNSKIQKIDLLEKSQVNVVDSSVIETNTTNFILNLTLKVCFTLSLIVNFYFLRKIRKIQKTK